MRFVRPEGVAHPGQAFRVVYEVSWDGAADAYAVFPPEFEAVDWGVIRNIESRSEVRDGTNVIVHTVDVIADAPGEHRVPEARIVYVDPDTFDRSRTHSMAMELEQLNSGLKSKGRRYILVGPGRWGSRDPWLGIPVNWSHISNAKIIVEVELEDFKVDPSLGSHFFHNVTSMNIGYFDIPYQSKTDFIDWHWIKLQELKSRTEHLVHARSRRPMVVKMDGRKSISVIYRG